MKIDPGVVSATPDRVGASSDVVGREFTRASGSARAGGDAVQVSGDAQLVARAAGEVGDVAGQDVVRPDVVARAREALANGEVGADLERLADRLIDGMLDQ